MIRTLRDFLRGLTCTHPPYLARCVHGDEINARNGARRACTHCGRSLPGDLPDYCSITHHPHTPASAR